MFPAAGKIYLPAADICTIDAFCAKIVREADIFIVIGTSLKVTPAAHLIRCPLPSAMKFIIDPCEPFDPCDDNYPEGYEHIREKATVGMEAFIDRIIEKN